MVLKSSSTQIRSLQPERFVPQANSSFLLRGSLIQTAFCLDFFQDPFKATTGLQLFGIFFFSLSPFAVALGFSFSCLRGFELAGRCFRPPRTPCHFTVSTPGSHTGRKHLGTATSQSLMVLQFSLFNFCPAFRCVTFFRF